MGWKLGGFAAFTCLLLGSVLPAPASERLPIEDRIEARRAVERVYYHHLEGERRPFDEAVPRDVLDRKVRRYLKLSRLAELRPLRETMESLITREKAHLRGLAERMAGIS